MKNKTHVQPVAILFLLLLLISSSHVDAQEFILHTEPETGQANNISHYLMNQAATITDEALGTINSIDDWKDVREKRYEEYIKSLGLIDVPLEGERSDLNVKVTGVIQKDGYRIEKLYYESLPSLFVPGNLYVPDNIDEPRPAVLYLCGHASAQKVAYQGYARNLAKLGFVCLIIETTHQGEVEGEHHGCYARGWFNWYSRGYTPAGVEVWNAIRGLDLLSERPEVDSENLGVTGRSGGGAQAWFVAAADERIKATVPEVGATTLHAQIRIRTVDTHCDCMMPINTYQIDFQNIGALIAPRALLIQQGDRDRLTNIEGVRKLYSDIKKIYGYYEVPDNVKFLEYAGGHGSTPYSRQYMLSFFTEQLMGRSMTKEEIDAIDFSKESDLSAEELMVYVDGQPEGDRTETIYDSFIKLAGEPDIKTVEDLTEHRKNVVDYLMEHTFGAFPDEPGPMDVHMIDRSTDRDKYGSNVYSFVSEEGWRLRADLRWKHHPEEKKPLLIVLRKTGDGYFTARDFAENFGDQWNIAYVNLRGTDDAGWVDGHQWHVRRASAWTGRTIASMQVYDLLRALELCRSLEGVDPDKISIAAREEQGAVALYAALLDNNIEKLILRNPPETQDMSGQPDGKGAAIEMLNCLRVTDLWQIPAMIPETDVDFVNQIPEAYLWSQDTRKKLKNSPFSIIKMVNK